MQVIETTKNKIENFKFSRIFLSLCLVSMCCMLTSCGGDNRTQNTQKFIEKVKHRPSQKIEALPEVTPTKTVKYSSQNMRSPFKPEEKTVQNNGLSPDIQRPKEELEAFPLDSLRMVGTITQNNKEWVLILASDKAIYKATIGSHIGQNYGRIVNISKDKIDIVETIPDSLGQWKERETSLTLVE